LAKRALEYRPQARLARDPLQDARVAIRGSIIEIAQHALGSVCVEARLRIRSNLIEIQRLRTVSYEIALTALESARRAAAAALLSGALNRGKSRTQAVVFGNLLRTSIRIEVLTRVGIDEVAYVMRFRTAGDEC
jgi:hypothetical protein